MYYKIIFLIISSNNELAYAEMKKIIPQYFTLFSDKIKYFFIENRSQDSDVIEINDHLYFNDYESFIPGIFTKTIKAINYINNNYEYDYVIRTNLSSFWNLNNILTFLNNKPLYKYACGYAFQGFISGTGVIMSRDVANLLLASETQYISDDVAISNIIQNNGIELYDIQEYKWGFMMPKIDNLPSNCCYLTSDDNNFDDILYFRLKNADRFTDVEYSKKIFDVLYKNNNIKYKKFNKILLMKKIKKL